MKKSKIAILVAGALVAGLTIGGMGIASATNTTQQTATIAPYSSVTMTGTNGPVATLSALTGLSAQEIMTLRGQGKSLATIATENGVDPAAVVDQTVAARKAYLDTLVAAGQITAAQQAAMLGNIRTAVLAMMNALPANGGVPSRPTTATPSVPATGAAGAGYRCPTPPAVVNAPAPVGPRTGSGSTVNRPCVTNVAPPAPAPTTPTQGATTAQGGSPAPTTGSSVSPTGPRTGMMGSGSTGPGTGSCNW